MHLFVATMGTFISAYSQSDFFGKLVILGLVSLSVMCWIILVHKVRIARRLQKVALPFKTALEKKRDLLLSLELSELPMPYGKDTPHPFGQVFLSLKTKSVDILNKNRFFQKAKEGGGVYLSPNDLELLETHVLTTISSESKQLEKNLFVLSTIITLAPFLGLLGTVWGILISFSGLQEGASAGSNAAILGGISTALATTVLGLVIAIPALVSHSYLKNFSRTFSSEMEDFLYQMLSTLEMQYRKADI